MPIFLKGGKFKGWFHIEDGKILDYELEEVVDL
jgi:hypothetical protein